MQAYCVKCRAKKEMKNPKAVTMKNKKPATTGTCPTCGTKMFKIGKPKQHSHQSGNYKAGSNEDQPYYSRSSDLAGSVATIWCKKGLAYTHPGR